MASQSCGDGPMPARRADVSMRQPICMCRAVSSHAHMLSVFAADEGNLNKDNRRKDD